MDADIERLLWCLLPDFDIQLARPRIRRRFRNRVHAALPEAWTRLRPSTLHAAAGGLVVTREVTEERAIGPVVGAASEVCPPRPRVRAGVHVGAVKNWIDEVLRAHDRPEWRRSWREAANAVAFHLEQYDRLDLSRYRFVLVPRQSHPVVRAMILAAERQAVPVVFIPHSPMTSWQVDLPVSYAALRGEAERSLVVRRMGADPARLAVVGNPDATVLGAPMPSLRPELPGVLAVSPEPEPVLRRVIGLLRDAGLAQVTVAPHPRSDTAALRRMLPPGWRMHRGGRTTELLRQGPPWTIQMSSGVAWEAAVLGIPTADVRLDGRAPDYPFLADESVFPALRDADDVARFTAGAAGVSRERLRAHASSWCATDGADAAARARAFLDGVDGPRSRIADGWRPGGTLRSASVLGV
ncbi:MAG: hypothetical protein QM604_01345 [Microbacterium sp.]